jgi:hypothetical protein
MWKRRIQAYLACVTFVGDQAGMVPNALARSPHAGNTIIILTGGHGFHVGAKDYIFKNSLWEESARVPLIVAMPDGCNGGRRAEAPVSLKRSGPTVALTMFGAGGKAHSSVGSRERRYTLCGNGEQEFYDHASDAHEWTNLAANPAHSAMKAELKRELPRLRRKTA